MKIAKRTIFNTPLLSSLLNWISLFVLGIFKWKIEGKALDIPKYVVIAAPHTSNWDFPLTMLTAFGLNIRVCIMVKKELTQWPFGFMFKWLGAIPIDRSRSNNTVAQAVQFFNESEELIIVIPPSGTRKKVKRWKSGFYHIANGANVPVALGYLDYARKTSGIGHSFEPTGDIETDMIAVKAFYADIAGRHPKMAFRHVSAEVTLM